MATIADTCWEGTAERGVPHTLGNPKARPFPSISRQALGLDQDKAF